MYGYGRSTSRNHLSGSRQKGVRRVLDSRMVAHVWAQRTQEEAQNGTGSLFFKGDTIYSYGTHFPIAQFVDGKRWRATAGNAGGRERAVLFTTRDYSVTTSCHMGTVRSALRDVERIFYVHPDNWGHHTEALKDYRVRLNAVVLKASRARSNQEWHIQAAENLAAEANAYAVFFGLSTRFRTEFTPELLQAARDKARVATAKAAAETKRKNAQREKLAAEALTYWLAGATGSDVPVHLRGIPYRGPVRLRVRGEEIETTLGARVPVAHAARVWRLVSACVSTGQAYQRNGHTEHVGQFAIDRVAADGTLTAGCHKIEYAELARVAGLLGLTGGA